MTQNPPMLAAAHRLDYSKMARQDVRTRIDSSFATTAVDKSCGGRNPFDRAATDAR
jgi:hypothetical protein